MRPRFITFLLAAGLLCGSAPLAAQSRCQSERVYVPVYGTAAAVSYASTPCVTADPAIRFPTDYTLWFDPFYTNGVFGSLMYADQACTTLVGSGFSQPVLCLKSSVGSISVTRNGVGFTYPAYSSDATLTYGTSSQALTATTSLASYLNQDNITIFTVANFPTASVINVWQAGNFNLSIGSAVNTSRAQWNDGANKQITKAYTANTTASFTYLHTGGNLSLGVNDTRTASLASVAAGANNGLSAATLVIGNSTNTTRYFRTFLAYNRALSEAERKVVERFLAYRYSITLPY